MSGAVKVIEKIDLGVKKKRALVNDHGQSAWTSVIERKFATCTYVFAP